MIERRLRRLQAGGENVDAYLSDENDDEDDRSFGAGPEAYLNSRMSFGEHFGAFFFPIRSFLFLYFSCSLMEGNLANSKDRSAEVFHYTGLSFHLKIRTCEIFPE